MLLGAHDLTNYNDENAYWVRRAVVEMLRHPEYRPYQKPNDIALLRLDRLVDFAANPHIRPVCLPTQTNQSYAGQNATATGWGLTAEGGDKASVLLVKLFSINRSDELIPSVWCRRWKWGC